MIYAMLAAYKRTLKKTLDQARSLDEVIASKAVPWLESLRTRPWSGAWHFGLHDEIEAVLERSTEDIAGGQGALRTRTCRSGTSAAVPSDGIGGGGGGIAPGLFSGSAIPDFGSMMSALGTIGNSPSSSGSGGGGSGGFSGGSSGGGGGGAGGGF